MIITLSPSPLRFTNSRTPISDSLLKSRTHFSKPPPSSIICRESPFLATSRGFGQGTRRKFRTCAIGGLDLGGFESAQSVLEAAAVLTAIIVVHESGHFFAAYLQGIHVSKFAVGFGPILAKFNSKNVEYSIRAFPLGGFVAFPDNDPGSDIPADDVNLLKNRPIFDRVVVISAGVIANVVFAYVIIFAQVLFVGLPVQESFPGVLVPEVRPFSAASRDGLLPGDVILGVDSIELSRTGPSLVSEVVDAIRNSPSKKVVFNIGRGGEKVKVNVTPDKNVDGTGRIGVQLSPNVKFTKIKPKDIVEAFRFSGREFWGLSSNVLDSLRQTFMNFSQSASKVSGPVAIIAVGAEVAKSNADGLFQFAAILNLNLASNLSIQQPKIEIDLCSQDDLNLLPFQQLETQLLDSMEIAEQQSSKSQLLEVFDDEHMEEVDGNIKMLSPGDNSTCMDDIPPTRGENQPVILGTSSTSTASKAINAPALKIGFNQRLKHSDRLHKYVREYGKMPIIFLKKDGHPTGKHASVFMTELGIAVKNIVPFKISSWKDVTKEQKQRICDTLESSFAVDFGSGPNSVRKETERLMNVRFRNNRRYMHQHYKTLTHLPWEERLKCVPTEYCESEADWEFMCTMFESEDYKKKSAVNSENAKSPFAHDRVSKPLTQYKYDARKKVARSSGPDTNPGNGWLRESPTVANNNKQIGSDNHGDGSRSLEGMNAANQAGDQVRENRTGCTFGLSNGTESENAKSTLTDDALGTVTKAELRNALASTQEELHSTKMSLQTTQDKVQILEANQKRLEERMEANERVMKQVFERIASDITQSLTQLPSSAPRL